MPPNMNAYTPPAASLSGRFGLPRTNAGQSSGKDVLPLSVAPASYKEQSEGCSPDPKWPLTQTNLGAVPEGANWPFNPRITLPVPVKLLSPRMKYMGFDGPTERHIFRLPLPVGTTIERRFFITYRGVPGLPVHNGEHPVPDVTQVDGADLNLDDEIPGPMVVIERGLMPGERPSMKVEESKIEKSPRRGYTLRDLLTTIIDKHHEYDDGNKDRESYPRIEWMFIVAVHRGIVYNSERWFPEIEIRIPKTQWYNYGPRIVFP
ncbi:hypothetical protein C8Q76DRAFT_697065 [Earliella scabrosa]|nr:hypothetical protein C8Q76DRAFT_697065 [Earliella scabrosa]